MLLLCAPKWQAKQNLVKARGQVSTGYSFNSEILPRHEGHLHYCMDIFNCHPSTWTVLNTRLVNWFEPYFHGLKKDNNQMCAFWAEATALRRRGQQRARLDRRPSTVRALGVVGSSAMRKMPQQECGQAAAQAEIQQVIRWATPSSPPSTTTDKVKATGPSSSSHNTISCIVAGRQKVVLVSPLMLMFEMTDHAIWLL